MEKLDSLVAEHIADRLLQPKRLKEAPVSVPDRRSPHHQPEEQSASDAHRRRRITGYGRSSQFCSELAETEGFEPSIRLESV